MNDIHANTYKCYRVILINNIEVATNISEEMNNE